MEGGVCIFVSWLLRAESKDNVHRHLISLAGAAIGIIFIATKLLSRETRVYRDKTRIFVAISILFVATKHVFC